MTLHSNSIFNIETAEQFHLAAMDLFNFQRNNCGIYKSYCDLILKEKRPTKISEIPFLPIQFFKSHKVISGDFEPEVIYTSSGTTKNIQSKHFVKQKNWYLEVSKKAFELQYGPLKGYRVLALLPSYLEREGSSLIDMVEYFISESDKEMGGFYLNHKDQLIQELQKPYKGKTLLIGVTFGLLDFAENSSIDLSKTVVMETGGMKGRRKELVRDEVHLQLSKSFSLDEIHSEYGMTELLSQAYSKGKGVFDTSPWMKILVRQTTDPFSYCANGKTGGINVIDLANVDSCGFIQTQDLGKMHENGTFEVLGRFDESDVRGCNLMIQ
tara:strand:+ start:85456 stop:86430 length:975 start_codon:yes stop_codon:yes gene_type:complete